MGVELDAVLLTNVLGHLWDWVVGIVERIGDVASYCCRIGVNLVFMSAFGIPVTLYTVFLVVSSHMLSQAAEPAPPGA